MYDWLQYNGKGGVKMKLNIIKALNTLHVFYLMLINLLEKDIDKQVIL
jgi:hypothetical protein